jgi:PQQ-dependent dehydrogenase (methanol/ethanol family)
MAFGLLVGHVAVVQAAAPRSSDWPLIGLNSEQQHHSPLDQITTGNVGKLGLAWFSELPTADGLTGVPLVADGVVYQSGALGKVFASDARTGKLLWQFDAEIQLPLHTVTAWGARLTRGLALWQDKVITAVGDCRLIALERKSGRKLWDAIACDAASGKTITGAPRVGGGKVFIGNANADSGLNRGHVDAFDANTGKHLWRFWTIPGDPAKGFESKALEMAAKTWGHEYWKTVGGGSAWDAITYDPKLNLVYFGVDAPSPGNPAVRGKGRGDELFTNSVVAVKADTGEYVWHYQTTPNDGWNFAATMHLMIAELPLAGGARRVVMTAPKNGFFYVLDAQTGKLLSAKNIVPVNWASHIDLKTGRPVEKDDAKYWLKGDKGAVVMPGPMGAHNWMPMAFSAQTGLVYLPVMEAPGHIRSDKSVLVAGLDIDFYYAKKAGLPFKGSLLAWDPVKQEQRWRRDVGMPYNGGVLSTAGDLVFQGTTDGEFAAYRSSDGSKVWSFKNESGILAAPSTVMVDGEQIILVPVGSGTTSAVGFASKFGGKAAGPARLLAFKLGGNARLPAAASAADRPLGRPPRALPATELIGKGRIVWDTHGCELCHGVHVIGPTGGSVPDLRRASARTHDLFAGIVIGGLYKDKGMPAFQEISMTDLEALQAYILKAAWNAYDAQNQERGAQQPRP